MMGANIQVIDSKDLPRPVKLLSCIPNVPVEPTTVLKTIAIPNPTIETEDERLSIIKAVVKPPNL